MTKEPKLQSAVRIVKEWPDYDNEIRRLQESVAAQTTSTKSQPGEPSGELKFILYLSNKTLSIFA